MPTAVQIVHATFADLPLGQVMEHVVKRQRLLDKFYTDPDSLTIDEAKLLAAYSEAEYRLEATRCTCNAGQSTHRQSCPLYPDHEWNQSWALSV